VAVENPNRAANCSCVIPTLALTAFTSTDLGRFYCFSGCWKAVGVYLYWAHDKTHHPVRDPS
jgi:hypothetical protein